MSTESDTPDTPSTGQDPQPTAPASQPTVDPRRRLRELLSVPERDRTDAQWDEINELEIQLAPGNRIGPGQPSGGQGERGSPSPKLFGQKKHSGKGGGKRRPRPGGGNPNKQPS